MSLILYLINLISQILKPKKYETADRQLVCLVALAEPKTLQELIQWLMDQGLNEKEARIEIESFLSTTSTECVAPTRDNDILGFNTSTQ